MPTAAKVEKVQQLREKLRRSKGAFLTSFSGLTVEEMTDLRRQLRKEQVEYHVVKNTLLRLAARDTAAAKLEPYLEGPSALALAYHDPLAPARVLARYARGQQKLALKAAVVEGGLVEGPRLAALAELPSREVLVAQLLGVLSAVPARLVSVLAAVPQSFVSVLDAIRAQKAKAEGA